MAYNEKDYYVETFFCEGIQTAALQFFSEHLQAAWAKENGRILRLPETQARYEEYMKTAGGSQGIAAEIIRTLGGMRSGFITNIFPYDAQFPGQDSDLPAGEIGQLLHTCLWNLNGPLTDGELIDRLRAGFGDKPARIFVNGGKGRTVKEIWHAQFVIDLA